MNHKNSKRIIYFVLFALLCAFLYLSLHEIKPLSEHIEQEITANIR